MLPCVFKSCPGLFNGFAVVYYRIERGFASGVKTRFIEVVHPEYGHSVISCLIVNGLESGVEKRLFGRVYVFVGSILYNGIKETVE